MSEKNVKVKFKEKIDKLKSIKNIEIIICIILIAIILLVYGLIKNKNAVTSSVNDKNVIESEDTVTKQLEDILSNIDGAGKVCVYIGYNNETTNVYAYDTKKLTTTREDDAGGSTLITTNVEETTSPVFTTQNGVEVPVIEKVVGPEITGVVIVSEGASDINVRLNLMRATARALNISEKIIEIFIMN